MTDKPQFHGLYDRQVTEDCERVLVTLLRGLGPWRESIFLVGGLVPRYLIKGRPPEIPAHAGTGDVDVVVDLAVLADVEAYKTLEENLLRLGFKPLEHRGKPSTWRWQVQTEHGNSLILELLADDPSIRGGRPQELPTDGAVSAMNIPHASMVFELHEKREVTAALLDGKGLATETIRFANLVSHVCLKSLAYDDRHERKDAHDLVYALEYADGGLEAAEAQFRQALEGKHADAVAEALGKLERRFTAPDDQGYRMDGPVSVAVFEIGEGDDLRDARLLRQRQANAVVEELLGRLRRRR
jgi:hypothetical protein